MSLLRPLFIFTCAFSFLSLTSCNLGGGKVDVVNPTVAEMDALDVQWGLTPRKSKGGPRRTFQYMDQATSSQSAPAAAAVPPPARENVTIPPPQVIETAPPAAAPSQPIPANLR
jgi:hypothetical protein